jgi:hypothetical protein
MSKSAARITPTSLALIDQTLPTGSGPINRQELPALAKLVFLGIREYCEKIWNAKLVKVELEQYVQGGPGNGERERVCLGELI